MQIQIRNVRFTELDEELLEYLLDKKRTRKQIVTHLSRKHPKNLVVAAIRKLTRKDYIDTKPRLGMMTSKWYKTSKHGQILLYEYYCEIQRLAGRLQS